MRATSPLDQIQYLGDIVELPKPKCPIGTKIHPQRLSPENLAYYWRKAVREILRDTQKIVYQMKREGYMTGMVGNKMLEHNKAQIRQKLDMMRHADSVEVAGHRPDGMHVTGSVSNQCYLQNGQCHSGVGYANYLLFRRTVDGNQLVYIHPHAIIGDAYLAPLVAEPSGQ